VSGFSGIVNLTATVSPILANGPIATRNDEGVSDIWENCKRTALRLNVWNDAAERLHDICLGDQRDLLPLSVDYLYRAVTPTMLQRSSSRVLGGTELDRHLQTYLARDGV